MNINKKTKRRGSSSKHSQIQKEDKLLNSLPDQL